MDHAGVPVAKSLVDSASRLHKKQRKFPEVGKLNKNDG